MTDLIRETPPKVSVYEAMFLISQQEAARLGDAVEHITGLVGRAGGEIIAMKKWDERRLAYEIDKQKRACFILVFFRGPRDAPGKIDREVNLDERVMRTLITNADHLTDEEIAVHDDRDGLMAEARLRAERGEEEQARQSNVRLGAPEPEAEPEAETEGDAGAEAQGEPEQAAPGGEGPADGEDAAPTSEAGGEPAGERAGG